VLQLDCPDLAGCRHTDYQHLSDAEFLADADKSMEALNAAMTNVSSVASR
jgi:5-methyltetrahydropteroyltriglutamate--homocysteine methyltransferase